MLTSRGRAVVALGPALYVAAWAYGTTALYPVSVGLVLAAGLAWAWVRLLGRPLHVRRLVEGGDRVEGDDVAVTLEVSSDAALAPSSLLVVERLARVGTVEVTARRWSGNPVGRYVLRGLPRGRYTYEASDAVVEDPFGLARVEIPLSVGGALLVYPRLVELPSLFSDDGAAALDGRGRLLRRPSGFDLHSVREYQEGESLRRVHWRTTAKRGQLMVKELEDEPRDEIAVLLDSSADAVAGTPPDSSFDVQVRAAGSILRAHARRGRRAGLVMSSLGREAHRVGSDDGDWTRALELLAAAEPGASVPLGALLQDDGAGAAARALELTIVTARVDADLVERLGRRALAGRPASLVFVDSRSWSRGGRTRSADPQASALLRLQSFGVPVTVVRRGDDLAARLAPAVAGGAAVG